ncbi:MAG: D-alanyl-D-alanine carboxypeptidase [Coriobacteriales bacterium]|jgi:D-alanyl-D-alanine carboxypeptidase (penicillin-binding protein 5/6)|nr:D-alanyl-D-alanine carboxypeptidase [Coriobacteriales bacterium]
MSSTSDGKTPARTGIRRSLLRLQALPQALLSLLLAFALCVGVPTAEVFADVRPSDRIEQESVETFASATDDIPDIVADFAGVCTADGRMLWSRDAATPTPMASTTKIMTALIALENSTPDTPMVVTVGAASVEGSSAYLRAGTTLTLRDLLYCLMLPSGNDAATVIAENVSGSTFAFIDLMNQKAVELGMVNTQYADVHGLADENHLTTVSDYLILTRHAMQDPLFREVVGTQEKTINIDGEDVTYTSSNLLLGRMEGATGVKTGFTTLAGYCLVASATRGGQEFYAAVFHSSTETQRFDDAQLLLEWAFRHYRSVELINATQQVGVMGLSNWIDKSVEVYVPTPVRADIFDLGGPITQEVELNDWDGRIIKGEACGTIIWTQQGEVLARSNLVAASTQHEPDFWQGLQIMWSRFIGGFSNQPTHIPTTIDLPEVLSVPIATASEQR